MPKLQITIKDGPEIIHEMTESLISVGRLPDNAIQILDVSVSSHHAELIAVDDNYVLKDIGSTNGTVLNGKALLADETRQLHDGDLVVFGSIHAVFVSENPDHASPMPEAEQSVAVAAESSVLPADFANASPFQSKKSKRSPVAVGILGLGIFAIVVFLGAVVSIFSMAAPL